MRAALQARLGRWLSQRIQLQRGALRLDRRRIYILPTAYGYLFAAMLLIMFLWAVNYNNNMGFGLTFLLTGVGLSAMWRSHNTLLGLWVHPGVAAPVFAGQMARFSFRLTNPDVHSRYGVGLALENSAEPPCYAVAPAQGEALLEAALPALQRGLLRPGRLRLFTCYPLGLFEAWSWLEFDCCGLVYPQPQGQRPLPLGAVHALGGDAGEQGLGSDDYAGLRSYTPGDSPRRVAWKATVRSGQLLVKQFTDQTQTELWLDWRLLAPLPTEARLSQLCRWVLKADAEGRAYGLRLPGLEYPPAHGERQRRRCLEALALYAPPAATPP